MNNNDNPQLDSLLGLMAKRLGTTPETLKKSAQDGTLSDKLTNMDNGDAEAFKKVLSDPQAAKKLLASPQAQKLLKMFGKK